jgi:hypothetical protein
VRLGCERSEHGDSLSMAMITSNFAEVLAPGLLGVIDQGFEQPEDQIDMFFTVQDSRRAFEEEFGVTPLTTFVETAELGATTYDDRVPRALKRYTHLKYVLGIVISREMFADDLYGPMRDYAIELGRSARETPQILAFNHFNRGFNSSFTGPDGSTLFATDHTLYGTGGTQANRPTNNADLHVTSLSQARTDMHNWTDDKGKKTPFEASILLVPPDLEQKAFELTRSEFNPEEVERVRNFVQHMGLQFKWNPYLTDTDAWFVLSPKQRTKLRAFWRERFNVRMWEDEDRGAIRARGEFRFSSGWSDYFGVYGSPGV